MAGGTRMSEQREVLSGMQKAAALLATLGEEASARIIKQLKEDEIKKVSEAIANLQKVSSEQAEEVLEEFGQMLLAHHYVVKGGLDYAKSMLVSAFGPDVATRLVDSVKEKMASDLANFDALRKADPQQLAKFIHNEHPQTIALVLSHLSSTQAASLLTSLPAEMRSAVSMRMAHIDQI